MVIGAVQEMIDSRKRSIETAVARPTQTKGNVDIVVVSLEVLGKKPRAKQGLAPEKSGRTTSSKNFSLVHHFCLQRQAVAAVRRQAEEVIKIAGTIEEPAFLQQPNLR